MFALLDNIRAMIGIDDFLIALTLDLDDESCNNQSVKERLKGYDNVTVFWGLSRSKIDAINRSIPMNTPWKYLMVFADDMLFTKKDFGKIIISSFEANPDAGLLHFPDGYVNDKLCTLPLMTRAWYEKFGYVYNPAYISVYADGEQMEVAKRLGKYKFIDEKIFLHRHYRWTKQQPDELNEQQDSPQNYAKDAETYHNRLIKNFDL
jgi:hypothetical protein